MDSKIVLQKRCFNRRRFRFVPFKHDLMFWQTSTQALYNLAAYPQYVGSLREEVDAVIRERKRQSR